MTITKSYRRYRSSARCSYGCDRWLSDEGGPGDPDHAGKHLQVSSRNVLTILAAWGLSDEEGVVLELPQWFIGRISDARL